MIDDFIGKAVISLDNSVITTTNFSQGTTADIIRTILTKPDNIIKQLSQRDPTNGIEILAYGCKDKSEIFSITGFQVFSSLPINKTITLLEPLLQTS